MRLNDNIAQSWVCGIVSDAVHLYHVKFNGLLHRVALSHPNLQAFDKAIKIGSANAHVLCESFNLGHFSIPYPVEHRPVADNPY
jgi:hypothetical protein